MFSLSFFSFLVHKTTAVDSGRLKKKKKKYHICLQCCKIRPKHFSHSHTHKIKLDHYKRYSEIQANSVFSPLSPLIYSQLSGSMRTCCLVLLHVLPSRSSCDPQRLRLKGQHRPLALSSPPPLP